MHIQHLQSSSEESATQGRAHQRVINVARFSRYVWGVLVYNLAVILWGAYVRVLFFGGRLRRTLADVR